MTQASYLSALVEPLSVQMRILAIFLLVVASALVIQAAIIPSPPTQHERKGFRLLGSLKRSRTVTKFGISSEIQEDWDYWESVNAAGWAEAKRDCEANGDTLLYLETNEEVKNVTDWLQDTDNTGSLYWVGGKYDPRSEGFIWDNGLALNPEAPWGEGQPRDKKPNTRVAASTIGREMELKTQANTVTSRYICESQRAEDGEQEQIPEPCYRDNDLVIVVDSSSSIEDADYEIAKEFTARLASTWIDNSGSRVAVQIFSNTARSIFGLTDVQNPAPIRDKVYTMPHIKSDTRSYLGIDLATTEVEDNERSVIKNIVFLTDGETYPEEFKANTKESAARANSLGIRIFAVGIGDYIDPEELLAIAGGNSDRVFTTGQFEELLSLLRPLSHRVCEE